MESHCIKCGEVFESKGREYVSRYEIVRRHECPKCGVVAFEVVRQIE